MRSILWVACALQFALGTPALAQSPVPSAPGWFEAEIGNVGIAGSASQSDDTFHVRGAGSDIWGTSDSFHFVYIPLDGDGDVYVLAASQSAPDPFAKAGVMIRQSLDPSSPHVIFDAKPDGGLELMTRTFFGGATQFLSGTSTPPNSAFLRISRRGAWVAAFISNRSICSMGCVSWTMFGDPVPWKGGPALLGLAVTSHDPSTLNEATLDFWAVKTLPAPWQQVDFYTSTQPDNAFANGQADLGLPAAGSDIWGTQDSFKYVWQQAGGNAAIVTRVISAPGPDPLAKAGVMMRAELNAAAPHVLIDVKPDGGIEFMSRAVSGGETTFLGGGFMPMPAWLKLERQGNQFTGSASSDGHSWTVIGTTTIDNFPSPAFIGLAATSHDGTMDRPPVALFSGTSITETTGSAQNLIVNPGFEDSTLPSPGPGWVSDTGRQSAAVAEATEPLTGAKNGACRTTDNLDCGMFQDVKAPTTGTYTLTIYANADRPGALVGANVEDNTVSATAVEVRGFAHYGSAYRLTFQASQGQTIRVWMYSPAVPGYLVIDDVTLIAPGPWDY